ncbi:MAG: hypothetical protein U0441_05455 [Polyangiaceae bacterium]
MSSSPSIVGRSLALASVLILGCSWASSGCSVALGDLDEVQCKTDEDCTARGGEFADSVCKDGLCTEKPVDPKWGCIGHVPAPTAGHTDTLTVKLTDLINPAPPTNLTLRLCNKYDVTCAAPLGTPKMDADGNVTVMLPSDIEAYLEITSPDYESTIAFLDHTVQNDNSSVQLVPAGLAKTLAQNAGVQVDDTKGIVLLRTADCTGGATAGASVTLFPSDMETRFYTIQNAVTADATQTDLAGNAGFVNVTPGTVTITGTVGPSGPEYGSVKTLIRAAWMTYQIVPPTPTL